MFAEVSALFCCTRYGSTIACWSARREQPVESVAAYDADSHVAQVLAHCDARRLTVVPQGGNTGLVGGSVPMFDEVVLCTAGLNDIRSFDPVRV